MEREAKCLKKKRRVVDEPSSSREQKSWDWGGLTENDPDDEVAIRGRLVRVIKLQQNSDICIRHIRLGL